MRIGVDIDGVVADIMPSALSAINKKYELDLHPSMILEYDYRIGEGTTVTDEIIRLLQDEEFALNIPVMDKAPQVVRSLKFRGHEVVFVTARKPESMGVTKKWIEQHFGALEIVHTEHKQEVAIDILIDDCPFVVRAFAHTGRRAMLYDQPWNRKMEVEYGVRRVHDWYEVDHVTRDWEAAV